MNNVDANRIEYSNSAISVTHEFYNKKFMVYVEGDDDISFWDSIFSKVAPNKYEMESLNGISGDMQSRIQKIKDGEISNVIVACDKDYTSFLDEDPYSNPYIITTYGHSIENTMFCPKNIAIYIKRLSKSTKDYSEIVNQWYSDFCNKACLLLPYEIANFINTWRGSTEPMPSFFGKNCCRFLDNNDPSQLDDAKILEYLNKYKDGYKSEDISVIKDKIRENGTPIRNLIKGHFITNGVMNLITKETKIAGHETKVESKQLYATFCDCISPCTSLCEDKDILAKKIKILFE